MGQSNSRYYRSDSQDNFVYAGDGLNNSGRSSNKFRHPYAVFFHICFKVCALLVYMFGNLFGQDFIGMFVTLVFFISMDFWVVKNVTGRLLAGLRWWNYIDDDGNSHWVFENRTSTQQAQDGNIASSNSSTIDPAFARFSQENDPNRFQQANGGDTTIFWMGLFIPPVLWFMFLFSSIFSFNVHWVLFIVMALVLSGSNLYGYIRCRFGKNLNYGSVISQYVGPKMVFNLMKSSATAAATAASSPQERQQSQASTTVLPSV